MTTENRNIARFPNGSPVLVPNGDAPRVQSIIDKRHAVAVAYCREKGWPENPEALSFDQIMEIRKLPEWVEAGR